MDRPSFYQIYMELALGLAKRSTCARLSVGAVIVSTDFRKVYAVGYNGNVTGGANDCDRHGEEAVGNCGCLHAECNAVINCDTARHHDKLVFCTHLPCVNCAKMLINLGGVRAVYYKNDYRVKDSLALFAAHHISTANLPCDYTTIQEGAALSRDALKEYINARQRQLTVEGKL